MKKNGFTLIELLVVISIIAVLSTIGLTTYSGIQSKARDSIRKNDLRTIATALEIYFQKNQHYPVYVSQHCPPSINPGSCANPRDQCVLYNEMRNYVSDVNTLLSDPLKQPYCYIVVNEGKSYRLYAKLENCSDTSSNSLCQFQRYNYSLVSDDLQIEKAKDDILPSPTPTPTSSPLPTSTTPPDAAPAPVACGNNTNPTIITSSLSVCKTTSGTSITQSQANLTLCPSSWHMCTPTEIGNQNLNSSQLLNSCLNGCFMNPVVGSTPINCSAITTLIPGNGGVLMLQSMQPVNGYSDNGTCTPAPVTGHFAQVSSSTLAPNAVCCSGPGPTPAPANTPAPTNTPTSTPAPAVCGNNTTPVSITASVAVCKTTSGVSITQSQAAALCPSSGWHVCKPTEVASQTSFSFLFSSCPNGCFMNPVVGSTAINCSGANTWVPGSGGGVLLLHSMMPVNGYSDNGTCTPAPVTGNFSQVSSSTTSQGAVCCSN